MTEYDDPIVGEIKRAIAVPVDVECEGYPDVIFNVVLDENPDQAMIETIVSALEDFMCQYNKKHFFRPIHYVSDIDDLPEPSLLQSVCVQMDCGNANPKLLVDAVKAIVNTRLAIKRIVLE